MKIRLVLLFRFWYFWEIGLKQHYFYTWITYICNYILILSICWAAVHKWLCRWKPGFNPCHLLCFRRKESNTAEKSGQECSAKGNKYTNKYQMPFQMTTLKQRDDMICSRAKSRKGMVAVLLVHVSLSDSQSCVWLGMVPNVVTPLTHLENKLCNSTRTDKANNLWQWLRLGSGCLRGRFSEETRVVLGDTEMSPCQKWVLAAEMTSSTWGCVNRARPGNQEQIYFSPFTTH